MSEIHVTDRGIEIMVANLLRIGVIIAGVVVFAGGTLYLLHHGGEAVDYHAFKQLPASDRIVQDIVATALHHRARSVIQLGILLLICTPIMRVACSLVGFALERDRNYVIITSIVLAVLLFSLISGAIRG